jgi:hypothetical protein
MSRSIRSCAALLGAVLLAGLAAGPAWAAPDAEGTVSIESATCEDLGIGFLCSGIVYTANKTFKVYAADNPDNPMPVAGNFTYIYTIANDPGSNASFGVITFFGIEVPANGVTSAGYIDGAGVEPSATEVVAQGVRWRFEVDGIDPGETSEQLFLTSPFGPGDSDDSTVGLGSNAAIDTQGTCVGPVVAPPPLACTIGFWKNREAGKKGLLKFYPDGDYDAVKAKAVEISTVFSTEAELVTALTSKGNRTIEERAKQQLAALVLNVAAGNLFPANTKCRLFFGENGTQLDTTGDGQADTTLEAAFTEIESNILSMDEALQEEAKDLADDINNGVGVIDATMFN